MEHDQAYVAPFIRKLMPDATEQEILEASDNLRRYLLAVRDMYRRSMTKTKPDSPHQNEHDRFNTEGDISPNV